MNTLHPPKGGRNFLRVNAVAHRYDTTASTIWRWSREARFARLNFPKPVKLGPNITAWRVEQIRELIDQLGQDNDSLTGRRSRNSTIA